MSLARTLHLVSWLALAMALTAGPVAADAAGCGGKNLLDEMKAKDPAAFARIRAAADAAPNGKSLLWKIESEEKPDHPASYLFATLHVTDERVKTLPPAVETALSVTSRIATGVEDMSSGRIQEALSVMHETLLEDKTARLETLLAKPEADRAAIVLAHTELPKDWQPRVKPWVVMALAATSACERSRLRAGKLTLDGALEQQAENRGVGSFGLESPEMALSALAAVPDDDQLSLLKAAIAGQASLDDQTETQIALYLAHDIGAMLPLELERASANGADAKAIEAYRHNVYESRNIRMRDRALMHLATGGVFIAVGAERLPGETGLVAMLRDAGYKVTAVE